METRSGWKANARIEFYKMVEFIELNKIQNVVFAFGDRIARNSEDYVLLKGTNAAFHDAVNNKSFSPNDHDQAAWTIGTSPLSAFARHRTLPVHGSHLDNDGSRPVRGSAGRW